MVVKNGKDIYLVPPTFVNKKIKKESRLTSPSSYTKHSQIQSRKKRRCRKCVFAQNPLKRMLSKGYNGDFPACF